TVKRPQLAIEAMAHVDPPTRLVIAGDGTQRANLEALASRLGVADRVDFLGAVGDEELLSLYADARAVVYVPYDEDFGYVTLEAFLARKPVLTCRDSGGTLEFVVDGVNGAICDPTPEALASAINRYAASAALAASHGEAGEARARAIAWDGAIEAPVGTAS